MPFQSRRARLVLAEDVRDGLVKISRSRTESSSRVQRAEMLLRYAGGESISGIARQMRTNRPRVERCVDKALQLGGLAALKELPGRGRKPTIPAEARTWVVSLACQKPKELGYSYELWTTSLLSKHVRRHCEAQGYPSLRKLGRGTVSKILREQDIHPHKISYYLERRDPEFDAKMTQVLCVYKQVELLAEQGGASSSLTAYLSYDEKPGIQAIGNIAPDLPPVPGKQQGISRDHEYIRFGTMTLMGGIDLLSGHIHGLVVERHRSQEFAAFLKKVDAYYPAGMRIRMVLDNHSAHISKETRAYLATVPNRFDFIFTPKHGSWLNLIESFFAKMAKTVLRGIRVDSKAELKERIEKYLDEVNATPVVFRWRYGLDDISVA